MKLNHYSKLEKGDVVYFRYTKQGQWLNKRTNRGKLGIVKIIYKKDNRALLEFDTTATLVNLNDLTLVSKADFK